LVIRTHQSFWRSRPSALLAWLTLAIGLLAVAIPYLPGSAWFGFVPLPAQTMAGLVAITLLYLAASEATKHWFFARERRLARHRRT
ncbi:MAG: hypothetical protein J0J14_17550, partial [Hyphomicrobium sp.]|nr:hypothetical protein [Hyphomicrobium sp.]